MKMFSTAQVSDIHVGEEGERVHGVDVRAAFLEVLEDIADSKPDLIVLSGDVCSREPDAGICRWVRGKLDALSIPYAVIPGNHDSPRLIAEIFGYDGRLRGDDLAWTAAPGGFPLVFLDSSSGTVSPAQLGWLREMFPGTAVEYPDLAPLVFIHHPPAVAGCRHMDENYALSNMHEVRTALMASPVTPRVFCGHYHAEETVITGGITIFLAPSTSFQIGRTESRFTVDHTVPGWRLIESDGTGVRTTVRYLFPGTRFR